MESRVIRGSVPKSAASDSLQEMHSAQALDRRIEQGLAQLSTSLARSYLELGRHLREMHRSKAHKLLGFDRWEDYLASKRTYGRTYLSYILRLAQAEGLERYLDEGLGASHLIEYAKAARDPVEIPALIDETWELVRDRPIREMRRVLRSRIEGLSRAPGAESGVWPDRLRRTLLRKMRELPPEQHAEFLEELRAFLLTEGHRLSHWAESPAEHPAAEPVATDQS